MTSQLLAAVAGLGLALAPAHSQDIGDAPMPLPRLTSAVTIDGVPDEPAWAAVAPLPLTALYPRFESPLTERTEIRIAYDSKHLYASIRAYDSESGRILAKTLYRDRWIGDDEFAVILDTFNDRENGAMFLVTPAGVRIDNLITNDAEPGRGETLNRDWNVPWEARAHVSDSGWTAEFRVPFTSMRYSPVGRETRMRLKTFRYLPRKGENQMFPPTRPGDGSEPHFQPSLGREIVLYDLPESSPVFVTPYALAQGADPGRSSSAAGLDVKLAPAPALALDITVNPDFAQVEADDEQLNLTRFSLFLPEKRPFFQERSGIFTLSTGANTRVFYTRRVGLSDDGRPLGVRGGARITGNVGSTEIGALALRASSGSPSTADETFGVLRVRHPLTTGGVAGMMITHRGRANGSEQTVAFDGSVRAGRFGRLSVAIAHALSDSARTPGIDNGRLYAQFRRAVASGFSYSAEYRGSGAAYDPAVGFVQSRGVHEGSGTVTHIRRSTATRGLREQIVTLSAFGRYRTTDDRTDEVSGSATWGFNTHGNVFGGVRVGAIQEHVPNDFSLTDQITVAAGPYTAMSVRAWAGTPFDRPLRTEVSAEAGGLYGGSRATATLQPIWTQSRHLEISAVLSATRLTFPGLPTSTERLARGRVSVALSSRWFADALVQLNSVRNATLANLRFRYNPAEGHDLWIALDQAREGANATTHRVLVVKYSRMVTLNIGAGG